jgi:hypothetical protein
MKSLIAVVFTSLFFISFSIKGNIVVSIGSLYDSATKVSYHYGFMQFLKSNPMPDCSQELALTHIKKDIYVRGRVNSRSAEIYFLRPGVVDTLKLTFQERKLGLLFALIRAKIIKLTGKSIKSTEQIAGQYKYKTDEFFRDFKLLGTSKNSRVSDFLPHKYYNTMPEVSETVSFALTNDFSIWRDSKATEIMNTMPLLAGHIPYMYYGRGKEKEFISFLSNKEVPFQYKSTLEKMVYPLESRPGLALSYIALADRYKASMPVYAFKLNQSALVVVNKLHCSDYQKYKMKVYIYHNLAELSKALDYKKSETLYRLAENVISEFLTQESVISLYNNYMNSLKATAENMEVVEQKADEIVKMKQRASDAVLGALIFGTLTTVGANAAGSSAFNSVAESMVKSAIQAEQQTTEVAQEMSEALSDFAREHDAVKMRDYSIADLELILENAFAYRDVLFLLGNEQFRNKEIEILKAFALKKGDGLLSASLRILEENFNDQNLAQVKSHMLQHEKKAFFELK